MEVKNKDSPIVYICSPYSGDVSRNLDRACRYSWFAVDEGCVPITPHLYHGCLQGALGLRGCDQ